MVLKQIKKNLLAIFLTSVLLASRMLHSPGPLWSSCLSNDPFLIFSSVSHSTNQKNIGIHSTLGFGLVFLHFFPLMVSPNPQSTSFSMFSASFNGPHILHLPSSDFNETQWISFGYLLCSEQYVRHQGYNTEPVDQVSAFVHTTVYQGKSAVNRRFKSDE